VDELGFGGRGRLILVEEMLDVPVEGAKVLAGKHRNFGGRAMAVAR
jgi:hypothetical protein